MSPLTHETTPDADGSADYAAATSSAGRARPGARRVGSGGPWEERFGYARLVRIGRLVVVSGTTAPGPDAGSQAAGAVARIATALEGVGVGLADVVLTRMFVVDLPRHAEEVGRAHAAAFGAAPPAATMVGVASLVAPGLLVEIEAMAVVGGAS